jgi:hypothetical protein
MGHVAVVRSLALFVPSAAASGAIAIPIFYVSRALAGTLPIVALPFVAVQSNLLVAAETAVYIPLSAPSLATVLFGLSLVGAVLSGRSATAFCMCVARVVYQAGMVMFLHPFPCARLGLHAIGAPDGGRVLLLALGALLWISSISLMLAAASSGPFIENLSTVAGQAPWTKLGQLPTKCCSSSGCRWSRSAKIWAGSQLVCRTARFTRCARRPMSHPTTTNVALFACFTLKLGYLLGAADRRAWALMDWSRTASGVLSLMPIPPCRPDPAIPIAAINYYHGGGAAGAHLAGAESRQARAAWLC